MTGEELMCAWRASGLAVRFAAEMAAEAAEEADGLRSALGCGPGASGADADRMAARLAGIDDAVRRWEERRDERQRLSEKVDRMLGDLFASAGSWRDLQSRERALEVLRMCYRDGIRDERIAVRLGLSVPQVRRLKRTAMGLLDDALAGKGE